MIEDKIWYRFDAKEQARGQVLGLGGNTFLGGKIFVLLYV